MKIGLYNECFPPIMDGVSQVVENYAQLLTERNHNVAVITAKVPFYHYNYNYTILNVPSVPMLLRPPYRIGFPIQILPPFIPAIQFMPDIMHAHSPFTAGNIALQLAKKHHIPFIITFHSKFRQDFEHSIHYKPLVDWMIKEIMKIYDGADEVWIPQLSVLDIMREYGYKGQVEVVPNAIDYDVDLHTLPEKKQEARTKLNLKNELCLLFVGQLIWEKNLKFIIDALAQLHGISYKMFFVGKGYAHDELIQLIKNHNLQENVKVVPQLTNRDELETYYFASDLFLFPSLYDNAPLVVREAAAHLTPSILIEGSTSAKEVIISYENGFLTANDATQFAAKIAELYKNQSLINDIGMNAYKTLSLQWKDIIPEIEDRYRSLIKRNSV